jgi:ribonuclease HIII
MQPHVVKVEPEKLEDLKSKLLESGETNETKTTSKYEQFRLKHRGQTIVAYTSGKVVATGEYAEASIQNAIRSIYKQSVTTKVTIGSDEAGKGEWLGPMVIAAVAINPSQSVLLRSMGVMDSKDLSSGKLQSLANLIEENSLSFKTVLISPKAFNERFAEFHKEGKNLNDMLAWGHAKAVSEVHSQLKGQDVRVVIDEFSKLKTKLRLERVLDLEDVELIQRPRAEDEIAVAAASILARNKRELWIDSESARLRIDLKSSKAKEILQRTDASDLVKVSYLR